MLKFLAIFLKSYIWKQQNYVGQHPASLVNLLEYFNFRMLLR